MKNARLVSGVLHGWATSVVGRLWTAIHVRWKVSSFNDKQPTRFEGPRFVALSAGPLDCLPRRQ